jgi:hypothetical protein
MSINVSTGVMIPANVLEVGNEISSDQLAAIQGASGASAANPMVARDKALANSIATQVWYDYSINNDWSRTILYVNDQIADGLLNGATAVYTWDGDNLVAGFPATLTLGSNSNPILVKVNSTFSDFYINSPM